MTIWVSKSWWNKVLWLISGEKWDTPVIVLHRKTKQLSVHQRTAMFTLISTQKVLLTSSPEYHSSKISGRRLQQVNNRGRSAVHIDYRLSLSRGSFFYRCTRIYAKLPIEMRLETNMKTFRRKVKLWVFENVPLMPPWPQHWSSSDRILTLQYSKTSAGRIAWFVC